MRSLCMIRVLNFVHFVSTERRLQPNELPHNIYIQNYSTATSTCLCMKKWVFTRRQEKLLCQHPEALKFIYWQV